MKRHALIVMAIVMALFLAQSHTAFAREEMNFAAVRQELRAAASKNIKIEGNLICDAGTTNDGRACTVTIQENATGRVYNLSGNNDIMRLFHNGTRAVAIEGTLTNGNTIEVARTTAR